MHIRLVVYTLLTYPHRYVSRLTMVVLLGHIKFIRIERLTHKLENKSEIYTAICEMPFYIQGWRKQFWLAYPMSPVIERVMIFICPVHRLQTPGEEIDFTARPKIKSQSWIFWYGQSIFCLPHWPKISDFFDFCLHWVSVVRVQNYQILKIFGLDRSDSLQFTTLIMFTLVSMVKG